MKPCRLRVTNHAEKRQRGTEGQRGHHPACRRHSAAGTTIQGMDGVRTPGAWSASLTVRTRMPVRREAPISGPAILIRWLSETRVERWRLSR